MQLVKLCLEYSSDVLMLVNCFLCRVSSVSLRGGSRSTLDTGSYGNAAGYFRGLVILHGTGLLGCCLRYEHHFTGIACTLRIALFALFTSVHMT